jgi:hypothetical protein
MDVCGQEKGAKVTSVTNIFLGLLKRNKIHSALILLLLVYWLPILRFGFDPHHDGLIVASVTNLDFGDTAVPFNQYGPAWFIILKLATILVPDNYLFLTLRLVTLFFYLISFLATYSLSRKYLSRRYSLAVVIVLLAIQPFVTDFNSDMIPWPSALSMFLIPMVGFLMVNCDESTSRKGFNGNLLIAGSLVMITTLTRVQIGLALLITVFILLGTYRRWKSLLYFLVGFVTSFLIAFAVLAHLGWVRSLVNDVIGFGSTYALGDRATFPKPIWTFLLTIGFVISYLGFQRFLVPSAQVFNPASIVSVALLVLFGGYLILIERKLNPIQTLTVLFRRLWISGLLAAAILGLFLLAYKMLKDKKLPDFKISLLVATSLVAQLQVWPLFDQMHAWWSATPCVILAAVLLKSLNPLDSLSERNKTIYEYALLGVVSLIASVTFISTMTHSRVPLQINGFSGILISEVEGAELADVNEYLQSQIDPKDRVLNLCTNANVFFDPEMMPKSSSRSFVFWTPMFDLAHLRKDILESNPTKVIACSFVTNPIFYPEYREKQVEILENFKLLDQEPNSFTSPNGVIWDVYSRGART